MDLCFVLVSQSSTRLEQVSTGGCSNHVLVWLSHERRNHYQFHRCHSNLWICHTSNRHHICLLQDRDSYDSSASEFIYMQEKWELFIELQTAALSSESRDSNSIYHHWSSVSFCRLLVTVHSDGHDGSVWGQNADNPLSVLCSWSDSQNIDSVQPNRLRHHTPEI